MSFSAPALMRVCGCKTLAELTSTAIAVESLVEPMGLDVVTIRKTGYRMKEA